MPGCRAERGGGRGAPRGASGGRTRPSRAAPALAERGFRRSPRSEERGRGVVRRAPRIGTPGRRMEGRRDRGGADGAAVALGLLVRMGPRAAKECGARTNGTRGELRHSLRRHSIPSPPFLASAPVPSEQWPVASGQRRRTMLPSFLCGC
ncbi:unnamed protein product [Urochloa humidicola]